MNKRDAIKKAYGKYWDKIKNYVSHDGWINTSLFNLTDKDIPYEQDKSRNCTDLQFFHRPLALTNIENNNGWIKIERENDYPREKILAMFIPCNKFEDAFIGYIDNNESEVFFMDKTRNFNKNAWLKSQITHWKALEENKPPLY